MLSAYRCRDCRHRFKRISKSFTFFAGFVGTLVAVTAFLIVMFSASIQQNTPVRFSDEQDAKVLSDLLARAKQGEAAAQFELALKYLNGDHTGQNLREAMKWFEIAANKQHTGAQYNLGLMYKTGRGTLQDYHAAARWFEKGAHLGSPESQFQLGTLYKVWYNLAAAKGYNPAIAARDAISTFMSTAEIAEAQELSKGWKPGQKEFLQAGANEVSANEVASKVH
jgi:uncharacterized protein